jgi:hypothetical protein
MDKEFGGVIWTNHALQRLKDRGVKQGDAWVTWRRPEQSRYAKDKGAWIYYRTFGNQKVEVVAKQNPSTGSGQAGEWIILSVWSRYVVEKKRNGSFLNLMFKKIFRR